MPRRPPRSTRTYTLFPSTPPFRSQTHHGSNVVIGPGVGLQGRYEIHAVLGDGGMGRVFAARDRLKDEEVAIKVLRNELLSSAAARGRFLSEAKVSLDRTRTRLNSSHSCSCRMPSSA